MIVGLAYNLKKDLPAHLATTRDAAAEYEAEETVERIRKALISFGCKVADLPYNDMIVERVKKENPDIVFNIAEGWEGRTRESVIPQILEYLSVPYTGSDPLSLGICLDKALTKQVALSTGIPTAPFLQIDNIESYEASKTEDLTYPVFVKPAYEGSSKGISGGCLVENNNRLTLKVNELLDKYHQPVLIEQFLPGREFTIAILGNEPPQILPIMEIRDKSSIDSTSFVYSYDTKVNNMEQLLCPAPIDKRLHDELVLLTQKVAETFKLRDFSRIDFRLDNQGRPNLLEINPLPGLSEVSLYPLCAKAADMEFDSLVETILESAVKRYPKLSYDKWAGDLGRSETVAG